MKTHTLALPAGLQGVDSGPEPISSLTHKQQDLSFHLRPELSGGLCANPFQEFPRFSSPIRAPGFCYVAPPGNAIFHLGASNSGAIA
jgi:hypothetical protein